MKLTVEAIINKKAVRGRLLEIEQDARVSETKKKLIGFLR